MTTADWPVVNLAIDIEKLRGKGEDAPPLTFFGPNQAVVAVFDGMGGAGNQSFEIGGRVHTGARWAARGLRSSLVEFLDAGGRIDAASLGRLGGAFVHRLDRLDQRSGRVRSRLRGSTRRLFPSTAALASVERTRRRWRVTACWAGDSRIYLWTPQGVQPLTRDHVMDPGVVDERPFEDSPLSNAVSLDRPFALQLHEVELAGPFALVAASDGAYGFVRSPMHFEWMLRRSLARCPEAPVWERRLGARIGQLAQDDATLVLLAVGFDGFRDLQRTMTVDNRGFAATYIGRLRAAEADDARYAERRAALWRDYSTAHHALLPPVLENGRAHVCDPVEVLAAGPAGAVARPVAPARSARKRRRWGQLVRAGRARPAGSAGSEGGR
jgi:serine/threonine protein phosphatase PrpC